MIGWRGGRSLIFSRMMHRSRVPDAGTTLTIENELMNKARILIMHPEQAALALLSSMLKSLGHEIDESANDRVAVRLMERGGVDLMLAGVDPTDADGLELLSYMKRKHRQVPVLLLFSSPQPERAKEAQRAGAVAVLRFPLPATELRAVVTEAARPACCDGAVPAGACAGHSPLAVNGCNSAPATARAQAAAPTMAPGGTLPSFAPGHAAGTSSQTERLARDLGIVGCDPSLRQAIELAGTIAPTRTPVLIVGEPGTGKALLARMIHALGSRQEEPLVVFDNSALAEVLAEHEPPGRESAGFLSNEGSSVRIPTTGSASSASCPRCGTEASTSNVWPMPSGRGSRYEFGKEVIAFTRRCPRHLEQARVARQHPRVGGGHPSPWCFAKGPESPRGTWLRA